MALHELLRNRREEVLSRFAERVRGGPFPSDALTTSVLLDGLPAFLDRLSSDHGEAGRPEADDASPAAAAGAEHGQQRYGLGFDVVAVAREWAIVRDVVLELIIESSGRIDLDQYRTLSRHVSSASVAAIKQHVETSERERNRLTAQHFGFLAHDVRNQLRGATNALTWMQRSPAHAGDAAAVIAASHAELARLLDRELTLVRLGALRSGTELNVEHILVADLLALAAAEIRPLAEMRAVSIATQWEPGLSVRGDLRLLRSALVNLVGNAVKFTHVLTTVRVDAASVGDRVDISVTDACGGLGDVTHDQLFSDHHQRGLDRTGFGFGLAICRQAVDAHDGAVTVQNLPGIGCTFVISLPRGA